jgi:hypothetical protein
MTGRARREPRPIRRDIGLRDHRHFRRPRVHTGWVRRSMVRAGGIAIGLIVVAAAVGASLYVLRPGSYSATLVMRPRRADLSRPG